MTRAFFVLELAPTATPAEVERQGRKLLGLLELGVDKHKFYESPLGKLPRDASMVREAMAALRDPKVRAREAVLAGLLVVDAASDRQPQAGEPVADAYRIGGYEGL